MAAKKQAPPAPVERGRYVGTTYPGWRHNGKIGTIVARVGVGVYLKFEGDVGHGAYLVHVNDVEVTA